ncbi:hypothetical protein PTKIN_Ptkin03bG0240000 [Pterospermum kingtungense]
MASKPLAFSFLLLISILISSSAAVSSSSFEPLIQLPTTVTIDRKSRVDDDLYCSSWHLSVETNNAGSWSQIPSRCVSFVQDYMTGQRYVSDCEVVANYSVGFASSVEIKADGKDAWIFDVDETLLSNLPYYQAHGFGSEAFDENSFDQWVDLAKAPAIPASLKLYNELKRMGFKIFVLTGRSENQRNVTGKNLMFAGYTGWERLLLRYHISVLCLVSFIYFIINIKISIISTKFENSCFHVMFPVLFVSCHIFFELFVSVIRIYISCSIHVVSCFELLNLLTSVTKFVRRLTGHLRAPNGS